MKIIPALAVLGSIGLAVFYTFTKETISIEVAIFVATSFICASLTEK